MKISDVEILKACNNFHCGETSKTPEESLANKYPEKVILAKMKKMEKKGLIDYGVSLRTAWLTDKGKRMYYKIYESACF